MNQHRHMATGKMRRGELAEGGRGVPGSGKNRQQLSVGDSTYLERHLHGGQFCCRRLLSWVFNVMVVKSVPTAIARAPMVWGICSA